MNSSVKIMSVVLTHITIKKKINNSKKNKIFLLQKI